jgi:hypothetical protein
MIAEIILSVICIGGFIFCIWFSIDGAIGFYKSARRSHGKDDWMSLAVCVYFATVTLVGALALIYTLYCGY